MHVDDIKKVARILQSAGESNKEEQSCLLGYIVGLEAPIGLSDSADDQVDWKEFFNSIPGQINEHYLINLTLAQEVADVTLKYRQAVMNGDNQIESLAQRYLTLTGAAFGLLGKEGIVYQIRKVLKNEVEPRRAAVETRLQERREAAGAQ